MKNSPNRLPKKSSGKCRQIFRETQNRHEEVKAFKGASWSLLLAGVRWQDQGKKKKNEEETKGITNNIISYNQNKNYILKWFERDKKL